MLEPGKFEQTPEVRSQLVANLIARTKQFTPETVSAGKEWYKSGQRDSAYLGEKFGTSTLSGAAALAKLSSGTDWNKNRMMGMQLLTVNDRATSLIHRAAEISGDKEHTQNLRRRAGLPGTPLDLQTNSNISAALKVRDNNVSDPMSIFKIKKNTSNKTPDFAQALATGGQYDKPVIDTHAYDAALDSHHIIYNTGNKHLAKAGTYGFLQGAYAEAHAHSLKHSLIPSDTTVSDYQAMHWTHQINQKVNVNPRAATTAKATETQTKRLLDENPQFNPETHGLSALTLRRKAFEEGSGK
jgi:hypothetical protein